MIRDGVFRKADGSESGGCVEVAALPDGGVRIRDSKRPGDGALDCTDPLWRCFLEDIKAGRFDLPGSRTADPGDC